MKEKSVKQMKTKKMKTSDLKLNEINDKNHEEIQKSIFHLAQAFANGFFIEVNCKMLPENFLDQLAHQVYQFVLQQNHKNHSMIFDSFSSESYLNEYVNKIYLGDFENENQSMNIILYETKVDDPYKHQLTNEDENQTLAIRWSLPHQQFESLWETLQFDLPLKSQLIKYVFTLIRFDKANINRNVIHCNQTVLLYGPPGCGKTTLCKGLAQKISIRMKELFHRFYFYELNAGSLFSKWFSQSSQNLSRFFEEILEMCSDPLTFLIVLIDEIESLSLSRTSTLSSNEPSDMLRVVNTLLTQIDRLKSFSNVLILTTSNLIEIIDQALIDRSDLILFIGPPSIPTIVHIYNACFQELIQKNLLHSQIDSQQFQQNISQLAKLSQGLSGRTLRKLPLIAFSHIQQFDQFILVQQLFKAIQQQLNILKNTKDYLQKNHY